MEHSAKPAFAVWITGLPASGKSSVTKALVVALAKRGTDVCVLESDALRPVLTPQPRYDEAERDAFYNAMAYIGTLLVQHGVPVIFDATANLRTYRDRARRSIRNFVEVYVACPLSSCMARDPKGIYRMGQENSAKTVPGLQAVYEPPMAPDIIVSGESDSPEAAALTILNALIERRFIDTGGV